MPDDCVVWVEFTFPLDKPETFTWEGTIKDERLHDIVMEFIRSQLGAGSDQSEANVLDVYKIKIHLDLTYDDFTVTSNCGNKDLRDGILMDIATRLFQRFGDK